MNRYKYPRTPHLPYSPGATDDDRVLSSTEHFSDKIVIVSEKLDGESTTLYSDHYHARSIDSKSHPSRNVVKGIWGTIRHEIPNNWRVVGENVYAKHSIYYSSLTSYFYVIGIFDQDNQCLSWDKTKEWAELLDIPTVPVIYEGIWDEDKIKNFWPRRSFFGEECEGYVVRTFDDFKYDDFAIHVAKFVRIGHVQTSSHWMSEKVVPNNLVYKA